MRASRLIRGYQIIFLTLATYGMFYFSYKHYVPWSGGTDFFHYYPMYQTPLDFEQAMAPFVYRQLGAIITNTIFKAGFYYHNEIAFTDPDYSQRIFFSALFSNYIALLLTATIVSETVSHKLGRLLLVPPIIGGLLCFLSFFTQQTVITGLTDGWSWLLIALGFYGYVSRKPLPVISVLILSIFQRETIPIVFFVLSSIDAFIAAARRDFESFYVMTAIASVLSFIGYLSVRIVLLPAEGYSHQLDAKQMLPSILGYFPPSKDLVMQGVVSQNIFFIFIATVIFLAILEKRNQKPVGRFLVDSGLIQVCGVLLVLYVVGLAAGVGNNIGRLGAMITPIVAVSTAEHLVGIESLVQHSGAKTW